MLNKDVQKIRIDVVEMLLEAFKDEPESMYVRTENYLKNLKTSLQQNNKFYEQEYKG